MARSTFYYHLRQSGAPDKYTDIRNQVISIYHSHKGRYGCRRITQTLHNQGVVINHKTVTKLMRESGIKCEVRIKKYRSYRGQMSKVAPNLLQRNFHAEEPNKKWVTDVTEISLFGQKRYLSPIMDLYNGEIISYTISDHPDLQLVVNMLKNALYQIDNTNGLILHSDQGWHYQHLTYQNMLKKKGIIQSMSEKGNPLDNAAMESFFAILKSELLYLQKFNSMNEFISELNKYMDYYNNQRIKLKLKGMSPVQYRTHSS